MRRTVDDLSTAIDRHDTLAAELDDLTARVQAQRFTVASLKRENLYSSGRSAALAEAESTLADLDRQHVDLQGVAAESSAALAALREGARAEELAAARPRLVQALDQATGMLEVIATAERLCPRPGAFVDAQNALQVVRAYVTDLRRRLG